MKYYRLHHNGNQTSFLNSYDECVAAIRSVIEKNVDLKPKCIFSRKKDNLKIVIYKYWTNYCDFFMIEEIEK